MPDSNDSMYLSDCVASHRNGNIPDLTPEAVIVLNAIMNTDFPISEKKDTTDMCYAIEKIKEEGIEQGKREDIVNMNSNGFSLDMIALATGKSIEEIESILAENSVADV